MGQSAEELKREIEGTRNDLSGTLDAIGDRVSPGRMMERRKNKVRSTFRSAREAVFGRADDDARDYTYPGSGYGRYGATPYGSGQGLPRNEHEGLTGRVADAASGMASSVTHAPDAMRQGAQGSPMLAGALAFGAGVLVSVLLPSSRAETQIGQQLMQKAEPLKDELMEAGHEVADHLKGTATEAMQDVKATAADAAHQVQDSAKQSVEETKRTVAQ